MCFKKYCFSDLWKEKSEKLPFFITHRDWSANTIFLVEKVEPGSEHSEDLKVFGTYYLSGEPESYDVAISELKGLKSCEWLLVTVSRKENYFHSMSEKDSYYREYNF